MKLINIYGDNSIYVGEMISGQRKGEGTLYILDDFFAGYKITGHWFNDTLSGWGKMTARTYTEEGRFNNGVPTGGFLRNYNDGRLSAIQYENGKNVSESVYSHDGKIQKESFGCVKLSESEYYLGDTLAGFPCGYGMIYRVDDQKKITSKKFVEIYNDRIAYCVELDGKRQSNKR